MTNNLVILNTLSVSHKMCTLTYLLHENGYELFFNRDEQHSRLLALPPKFNQINGAIYPIDPQGGGTWIAVNQQGLSLALLNYYQAPFNLNPNIVSRGQLILSLLQIQGDVIKQLQRMDLSIYQPFQLCIFPEKLSLESQKVYCFKWDGTALCSAQTYLPITSSSIDFNNVSQKRQQRFIQLVDINAPQSDQLKAFHHSIDTIGKYSVYMQREDAQTVSISHISVGNEISFEYFDNVLREVQTITHIKKQKLVQTS